MHLSLVHVLHYGNCFQVNPVELSMTRCGVFSDAR